MSTEETQSPKSLDAALVQGQTVRAESIANFIERVISGNRQVWPGTGANDDGPWPALQGRSGRHERSGGKKAYPV